MSLLSVVWGGIKSHYSSDPTAYPENEQVLSQERIAEEEFNQAMHTGRTGEAAYYEGYTANSGPFG